MGISNLQVLFRRVDHLESIVGHLLDRVSLLEVGANRLNERLDEVLPCEVEDVDELASTWFVVDGDDDALSRADFSGVHTSDPRAMKFFNKEDATRFLNALEGAGMVGLRLKEVWQ